MTPTTQNIISFRCLSLSISILLGFAAVNTFGAKLNAPKVLLPYHSSTLLNFTLKVEYSPEETHTANTCFQWSSTRPDVAQIHVVNSSDGVCAHTAVVSAVSRTPQQMTAVILARNRATSDILQANIIVCEVVRLEIETTTRVLYLDDSPEQLMVYGFDSGGNMFSNLEGLSFDWSIQADNSLGFDAQDILRFKKFSESYYTSPRHIATLEEEELQGDTVLVEGVHTGSAQVSVSFRDPVYKSLKPTGVQFAVVANIMLSPPVAYVLLHGRVNYTVGLLRHNLLTEIKLPSKQFYIEVQHSDICQLHVQTSTVTALALGSTEVFLKDRNLSEFFPQPSAVVYVTTAMYLVFVVSSHKWVLETNREYEIYIEIYDSNNHKIFPSDNVRVKAEFPKKYLNVLFSSLNGTYHRVQTLVKGEVLLEAALVSVITQHGEVQPVKPEVRRNQLAEIFDPVTVAPERVVFPWNPLTMCAHSYTAQATGGSGEYVWNTLNSDVASVSAYGLITTTGSGKGVITAADTRNTAHFGVSNVFVLPPADMNFPSSVVEAVVGSKLLLPLALSAEIDGHLQEFTDCRQLSVNVTLSDSAVFEFIREDTSASLSLPKKGCTVLSFLAKRQGHTEVMATYRDKEIYLKALVTIAAFYPLKAVETHKEVVVSVGSSREVVFKGGPQPWVLDSSKFFHTLNAPGQNDKISAAPQLSPGQFTRGSHVFIVSCLDLFDEKVELTVGNGKTATNMFPVSETASIRFVCAVPTELHLVPVFKAKSHVPPCPIPPESNNPIPVHYQRDLDLIVTVTDSVGHRFDNFSSLAVEWHVSDVTLVQLLHLKDLVIASDGFSVKQTIQPKRKTGSVLVTASVGDYKPWVSRILGHNRLNQQLQKISKSVQLTLVQEAVLSPSSVSIFNHPSNKIRVEIQRGSGYFWIEETQPTVMLARYEDKSRTIEVTPLKDGIQSFTVYDLCIEVPVDAEASVTVSGVGSIKVMVQDKVQVMKEVTASVQVLNLNGTPLLASFFSLMDLRLEASSDIVNLRPLNAQAGDSVTRQYTVLGAALGHTSLTASIKLPTGQVLFSSPKSLEVFPPLRLEPKNISLIIGSVFQVLAMGGPQSSSTIEFSVANTSIAYVSATGVLDALTLGTTQVLGKSVGLKSDTGEQVVYSEDLAIVNVVILTGIRIYAPLTRLQTGEKMPVYAVGLTEHDTPFSFGQATPPLTFTWSVNNEEVLQLKSVYHASGVIPSQEHNFAQQAIAKEQGLVTLKLRVEAKKDIRIQILNNFLQDEVHIHVYEKLALITPPLCHGQILMTSNTDAVLKTNRDTSSRVQFTVTKKTGGAVVQLLDGGVVRSGQMPGQAVLSVVASEQFGVNQTLVILILVKPVSYIMINQETVLQSSMTSRLSAVPIGVTLHFTVSYHDDVGAEFYATNIDFGFRCSRSDLVQVSADNNTLVVRAVEAGHTVLKVWDKSHPLVADYVSIPVASAISPSQTSITLGSIVCFSSPVLPEQGTWGWWKSKSLFLDIEQMSGIAVGRGIGQAHVIYSFSFQTSTKTEVTVEAIQTIIINAGIKFLTNSITKAAFQFFPVSFTNAATNLVGPNCSSVVMDTGFTPSYIPFHCVLNIKQEDALVSIEDIFTIDAYFDNKKGQHGCLVTQNTDTPVNSLATMDIKLVMWAQVPDSGDQPELTSEPVELDFVPAFFVHNTELHLTTLSPLTSLRVSGVPSVLSSIQVKASDPNLIQVKPQELDSTSSTMVSYPVRLLDSLTLWEKEHLNLFLDVIDPHSGHRVRVDVTVKLIGLKPDIPQLSQYSQDLHWAQRVASYVKNSTSWTGLIFIIFVMVFAQYVVYQTWFGPKLKTAPNSSVFLPRASPAPASPYLQTPRGSPVTAGSRLNTSQTPPLKVWSVSYNQDGRTPVNRKNYTFSSN